MKQEKWHIILLLFAICCCSCTNINLDDEDACDTKKATVRIIIRWEDTEMADKPTEGMAIQVFRAEGNYLFTNSLVDSLLVLVNSGIPYSALCYDYYGNYFIHFRDDERLETFEAFGVLAMQNSNANRADSKLRNGAYLREDGELVDSEPLISEPYPHHFFLARTKDEFTAIVMPSGDTISTLYFYPHDVLREFTFLITDVVGGENITQAEGSMSGLSSAYKMQDGTISSSPATVLFGEDEPGRVTWSGDSIMGTFCTFGVADINNLRNRLTINVYNQSKEEYAAVWGGLWQGIWENTVREQMAGALGANGTKEEQAAWRARNGGYDIVLKNEGRLEVPKGNSGFQVKMPGFNDTEVPAFIIGGQ